MNSVLNPEAPEFYPHIASFTQGAYTSITKTIRTSNTFPFGSSYDYFKRCTDFNVVTCQLSESVLAQSNEIVTTEMPTEKLTRKNLMHHSDVYVCCTDCFLDRADINMNMLNNEDTDSNQSLDEDSMSNWNNGLVISKIRLGSKMFIGAKNIPRPQLMFKDPVDNTNRLWVPRIKNKPNSIKPLALNIIYNNKGVAIGYEHPYKVEIDLYEPPQEFVDPDPEPPCFPAPMEQTQFTYIETESQVDQLVEHLNTVNEIAVDVEHHSYRTYQGITCLIQITTNEGGDFIIDTLAVREHIHKLNLSFTDPRKLKIFHGAEMDVIWLQRDFGLYIVGLFDTHQAAKALHLNGLSLKHLLMKYCEVNTNKKYQLADWRMRPLPSELIKYARLDTHYLIYIWRRMKADLLTVTGGVDRLLLSVFTRSKFVCAGTYVKNVTDDSSHIPLYIRSKRTFDTRQMAALKLLYNWRDGQARMLDESISYLLPNHMMLALAGTLPRDVQGVHAICSPMPPFVKQNVMAVHRMILSCRQLSLEPFAYPVPSTSAAPTFTRNRPTITYDIHDFSDFPKHMKNNDFDLIQPNQVVNNVMPKLTALIPDEKKVEPVFDLTLNFIPPYYRYKAYIELAKHIAEQEIKEKEEKKRKYNRQNSLPVIISGEDFIKLEVFEKSEESKETPEKPSKRAGKSRRRKRKMSLDKTKRNIETDAQTDNLPSRQGQTCEVKSDAHNSKPDTADNKSRFNDSEGKKQAKMND